MSERPKGPEIDQPSAVAQGRRQELPGAAGRRSEADALEPSGEVNPQKLKHNRERLQVGSDHKTEAMKKGKRGSYP